MVAARALESANIMIRLVGWLDAGNPHGRVAIWATRPIRRRLRPTKNTRNRHGRIPPRVGCYRHLILAEWENVCTMPDNSGIKF
jgi:hypothetical protein